MAVVELGYPITSASGRFGGGMLRRGSTQLLPPPPSRPGKEHREVCPCKAWRYADRLWVMGVISIEQWRRAMKRPGMSVYDLWMHEAVAAMIRGHYCPDEPSVSGGYATSKIKPGYLWQPSELCIPTWPLTARATLVYTGSRGDHWLLDQFAADQRTPTCGIIRVEIWAHPQGLHQVGYLVLSSDSPSVKGVIYSPHPYQPFWRFRSLSRDGLYNDIDYTPDSEWLAIHKWSIARDLWQRLGQWE